MGWQLSSLVIITQSLIFVFFISYIFHEKSSLLSLKCRLFFVYETKEINIIKLIYYKVKRNFQQPSASYSEQHICTKTIIYVQHAHKIHNPVMLVAKVRQKQPREVRVVRSTELFSCQKPRPGRVLEK